MNYFNNLIEYKFTWLLLITFGVILTFITIFSTLYLAVSDQCGLALRGRPYSEAWLFALMVYFRIALEPTKSLADAKEFWNGCYTGFTILAFQALFTNLIMSIFISSLIFNFQSFTRRNRSQFNCITCSKFIEIDKNQLILKIVESSDFLNIKVFGLNYSIFLFRPDATGKPITCIRPPTGLINVSLPLSVECSFREVLNGGEISQIYCKICGESMASLSLHQSFHHPTENPSTPPVVGEEEMSIDQFLEKFGDCELIYIIEGNDPVTGDRVQVRKVYNRSQFIPSSPAAGIVTLDDDFNAVIDYSKFL